MYELPGRQAAKAKKTGGKKLSAIEAAALDSGLALDVTRAGKAVVTLADGSSAAVRVAREKGEQIFHQFFYGHSREIDSRALILADDIAIQVTHAVYRDLEEDKLIRIEFDGTQGTVLTGDLGAAAEAAGVAQTNPARAAAKNQEQPTTSKSRRVRVVDHAAKWLCVFGELHLVDDASILPIPARIHSFTQEERALDADAVQQTESFKYARAVALLIENLLPSEELFRGLTFLSLASDFGGSSNAGQHYVQSMLKNYVLGQSFIDQGACARQRFVGTMSHVLFCEEHPNSTSTSKSLVVFFDHVGMFQRKFLARQYLEATGLRYSRLAFAENARENPDGWDPRPPSTASDEDKEPREVLSAALMDLYPDEDRRKQHFQTLCSHVGPIRDCANAVFALLGLLILLVSPSAMRWGTVGSCARHLSLLNVMGLQERISDLSPLHCGKNYWLYKGRPDVAFINLYLGAATLGADRVSFSHQNKKDAGSRADRLQKVHRAYEKTVAFVQWTADAALALYGFTETDAFAVRVFVATYLAAVSYLVEMQFRYSMPLEDEEFLAEYFPDGGDGYFCRAWFAKLKLWLLGPEPAVRRGRASGMQSWWRWMKTKVLEKHLLGQCLIFLYAMVFTFVSRTTRRVEGLHATAQRLAVHSGANVSLERQLHGSHCEKL
eukprot:g10989.t1